MNYQPLFLDPEAGIWVVLAHFTPGATLPVHLHTGAVHGYTLERQMGIPRVPGPARTTAGSYLYEPGSSIHQFYAPEDNTEDTVVLFIVYGANIELHPRGPVPLGARDAITIQKLTAQMAEAQGFGKINYLTGGSARFTESK